MASASSDPAPARAEIYRLLREFCAMDYVLLMASSDLEEVVGIADTVVTMYRGKMVSTYQRGRINIKACRRHSATSRSS